VSPVPRTQIEFVFCVAMQRFEMLDRELALRDKHAESLAVLMLSRLDDMNHLKTQKVDRSEYLEAHSGLAKEVSSMSKFIWIAMGAGAIIQFLVVALLGYFLKK
jgi:hypothetical protein